jgi:O-acetyl-ADP-ribose deacetylase (regulator of RNase III)
VILPAASNKRNNMGPFEKIRVVQGDITRIPVDAIVNAANSSLMGGGGVDGAIHRAGGPAILEECKKIIAAIGSCKTGEAVITSAGNLPARHVIHTVGPVWRGGNSGEEEKLGNCYINALQLALVHQCQTISFPNISTGVYGFPKKEAAVIAVNTVFRFLGAESAIQDVFFVCFDRDNFELVQAELNMLQLNTRS